MVADCCTMDMFQPITTTDRPPGDIPDGLKMTALADPNSLDPARAYPVLSIGSFLMWPMSYYDNRVSFGMVLYDPVGKVANVMETPGARYIVRISKDGRENEGSVTFWGQANQAVTLGCMEIDKFLKGG